MDDELLELVAPPLLVICPKTDTILSANKSAHLLFEQDNLSQFKFSNFLVDCLPNFIVFVDEVFDKGLAWTRKLKSKSFKGELLDLEFQGKLVEKDDQKFVALTLIDLKDQEVHATTAQMENLQSGGMREWRRAEAFFRDLEQQNRLILDAAGEGIYGVSSEGKTTFVNRAACEILGWEAEDLIGHDIHSMIHHHYANGDAYPHFNCPIYKSFRNEEVARVEDEVFWRKDGKAVLVEYVSTPIYEHKVLAGAVVIFRDISERKENERKLHEAMEEVAMLRDRLEEENAYLQEEIQNERAHYDIVGKSPAINRTLAQIDLVAKTDASVLIEGENGTGKGLVASAIHKASPRALRPLIRVNCAAIPRDNFELEFFGKSNAGQGGVHKDKLGKFELANGGTLFLDEVGEIPMDVQGTILSVLQDGVVQRMGEDRQRKIDIRLVATSKLDLEKKIEVDEFREDLFFHLNVFPITVSPLRERVEDIPLLTAHFLKLACERLNMPLPTITRSTLNALASYHWPGNIREMQNVIERGVILARGGRLVFEPPTYETEAVTTPLVTEIDSYLTEAEMTAREKANLIACLKAANGKVSGLDGAADLLGVKPTTFYSRMKKHSISDKDWV